MTMRATKPPKDLDPVDLEALQRAIAQYKARSAAQAQHLADLLKDRSWLEVAQTAVYSEQIDALHLRPWEPPPCVVSWSHPKPGDEEAAALLERMLESGLSRYEPNPMTALGAMWDRDGKRRQ
jgi:hypothetical protein